MKRHFIRTLLLFLFLAVLNAGSLKAQVVQNTSPVDTAKKNAADTAVKKPVTRQTL